VPISCMIGQRAKSQAPRGFRRADKQISRQVSRVLLLGLVGCRLLIGCAHARVRAGARWTYVIYMSYVIKAVLVPVVTSLCGI
jgi:hypothetical protein